MRGWQSCSSRLEREIGQGLASYNGKKRVL